MTFLFYNINPMIAGEINDADNTVVGIFELNWDDSVTLRDAEGNVIQSAGQSN